MIRPEPAAIERVLIDSAWHEPDTEVVERSDWYQLVTPSHPAMNRNAVYRARMAESDVPRRVAETIELYRRHGAAFRWIVGPSSAPDDLSERLVELGLPRQAWGLGMVREVEPLVVRSPPDLEITALRVEEAEVFGDATGRGWQRDAAFARQATADARAALLGGRTDYRFHLARLDGHVVGTSLLRVLPSPGGGVPYGYLQGGAVVPEARGRGIYRAMVARRLADLAQEGVTRAVVWASEATSAPILAKLGFSSVCRAAFHQGPASAGP